MFGCGFVKPLPEHLCSYRIAMYKPQQHPLTLQELLDQRGISKVDITKATGLRENTLRRWQRREVVPGLSSAIAISKLLNVSLKTFSRSIGLDVEGVPDDVHTEINEISGIDPDAASQMLADADVAIRQLHELKKKIRRRTKR
jgi:transcriptional regulator with XRE-family HTH domain